VSWELGIGLITGGVGLAAALGAVIYALTSVRGSHKETAAANVRASERRDERDVERRLRQEAEVARDRALADVERLGAELAASNAAMAQLQATRDQAAADKLKEDVDAVRDGTLGDATDVLNGILRR
jgi:uncharacterized membrane protein YccC